MTVRTAVIPAAGLGTRGLPATKAVPKEMLPVVDKPVIQYVLEEAVKAGIDDVLIITGRSKKALEDHFDRSPELESELVQRGKERVAEELRAIAEMATIHLIRQGQPLGLGHAVQLARRHVGGEPFAVLLPDELMHHRVTVLADMIAAHARTGGSVVALKRVPHADIGSYGCAVPASAADGDLLPLAGIVEKPAPAEAPSDLAVVGRYVFTPAIFEALDEVKPGTGRELQLTDAIARVMDREPVSGLVMEEGRYDTGSRLDFLRATVELALEREDIGPSFAPVLAEIVQRHGLLPPRP